jgi:fructokinase
MVTCIGEALIDFIPQESAGGETCFLPSPGGSPFNAAISLARLEVPTGFLAQLSNDFFGDMLLGSLSDNGVDVSLVRRADFPTTLAFVTRDERGDARYAFFAENSADRNLRSDHLPATLPNGEQGCLLFGSISTLMEPGASTITQLVERESERTVVTMDPNVRSNLIPDHDAYVKRFEHWVRHTTMVKISDDDLAWIYPEREPEDAARHLLSLGTTLVVLTMGADGSIALGGDVRAEAPAAETSVSDTIGAGDSFHGGFIAWLYHHRRLSRGGISSLTADDLGEALTYAATVSGITCARAGANPPTAAEVAGALGTA